MAVFRPAGAVNIVAGIDDDRKIHVSSIGHIGGQALFDFFKYYGEIEIVRVFTDSQGNSQGYAIILFKNIETAAKVLMHTIYHIKARRIYVNHVNVHFDQYPYDLPSGCKIYVRGINQIISDYDIIYHFSQYGRVIRVDTPLNANGIRMRNFSIVTFSNVLVVDYLLKFFPVHGIKGALLYIYEVQPIPGRVPNQPVNIPVERNEEYFGGVYDSRHGMWYPYASMLPSE